MNPSLKIDDREPKHLIELLDVEFEEQIETIRLDVADYVCGNVAIERKAVPDFLASMNDGRLFSQVQNMMANYEHNYIVVVGSIDDIESEKLNAYLGMQVSIAVRTPIKILHVSDDSEFVYVVKKIIEKQFDGKEFARKIIKPTTAEDPKVAILCQIPGIGSKTAKEILKKYDSILSISTSTVDELTEIDGIGKKMAGKILDVLTR